MSSALAESIEARACEAVENTSFDFTAKFLAVYDLFQVARKDANRITPRTVTALGGLLLCKDFDGQRQRIFLFREAANVLALILRQGRRGPLFRQAYQALCSVLRDGCGHAHLAAAEALGTLPLAIRGPDMDVKQDGNYPTECWHSWLKQHGIPASAGFRAIGRSLTAQLPGGRRVVVKLAACRRDALPLQREVQWMRYLARRPVPPGIRFEVPEALGDERTGVFRLKGLPAALNPLPSKDYTPYAIAFIAPQAYYDYPNATDPVKLPAPGAFLEIIGRSAFLLGFLTGRGIIHDAPIPLFHNRVQHERRRDGGAYEWFRAGRLDRWLASCAYPNFGVTGLRDFEHFASFDGNELMLFRQMGNHLLSLLLVTGSYFRAKDPWRAGLDAGGNPVDARDLFDAGLLRKVISAIYSRYHTGFTGRPVKGDPPFDAAGLTGRMIDEMGVDRHMTEILRIADQQRMLRAEFETFLRQRGFTAETIAGLHRGVQDLKIHTGPHLGEFNRSISLPELIEGAAAMAAVCVAEKSLSNVPMDAGPV